MNDYLAGVAVRSAVRAHGGALVMRLVMMAPQKTRMARVQEIWMKSSTSIRLNMIRLDHLHLQNLGVDKSHTQISKDSE